MARDLKTPTEISSYIRLITNQVEYIKEFVAIINGELWNDEIDQFIKRHKERGEE